MREVVAGAAIAKTMPLAGHEECSRPAPEQPVPLAAVAFEPLHDAMIQRQQSLLAEFALPDVKNAGCRLAVNRKNLPQHFQLDSAAPNLIHGS